MSDTSSSTARSNSNGSSDSSSSSSSSSSTITICSSSSSRGNGSSIASASPLSTPRGSPCNSARSRQPPRPPFLFEGQQPPAPAGMLVHGNLDLNDLSQPPLNEQDVEVIPDPVGEDIDDPDAVVRNPTAPPINRVQV